MSEGDIVGDIFGLIGSAISTFFFIAPVVPFIKLIKKEITVKESPGILLLCTLLNCILWGDYGLLYNRFLQYGPNALGALITLVWTTIFLIYLADRKVGFVILYLLLMIIAVAGLTIVFYLFVPVEITGKIVVVFNVLMYASPGEKMVTVCKTGNYQLIPIWSTLGGLACSACWFIYGIYLLDWNVMIPNALGVLCSIIQIIVFLIFKGKSKNVEKEMEDETEGDHRITDEKATEGDEESK